MRGFCLGNGIICNFNSLYNLPKPHYKRTFGGD